MCRETETELSGMNRFENVLPRYRIMLVRESEDTFTKYPKFQNSRELFDSFREELAAFDREHFVAITLDSKNRTIGYHTVSIGSHSTSVVHQREVWKSAILAGAAAVIFIHNHPSGDPAPSREDRDCTNRLVEASKILGIRVLDHIIFGETDYYSFADAGLLT